MNEQQAKRYGQILARLKDKAFTKEEPLHAADLDLERKVLENEGKAPPYLYVLLHY